MATEFRRIALADPHTLSPPRFVVGGQLSHTVSGDVKLYEWDRDVSHLVVSLLPRAERCVAERADVDARPADRDWAAESPRVVAVAGTQTPRRRRPVDGQDASAEPRAVHALPPGVAPARVARRRRHAAGEACTRGDGHRLLPPRRQLSRDGPGPPSVRLEPADMGHPRRPRRLPPPPRRRRLSQARTPPPDNGPPHKDVRPRRAQADTGILPRRAGPLRRLYPHRALLPPLLRRQQGDQALRPARTVQHVERTRRRRLPRTVAHTRRHVPLSQPVLFPLCVVRVKPGE